MQEEYTLDKNSPIILYGFGLQGRRIHKNFKECGFSKLIIIDKRAEELLEVEEVYPLSALDNASYKGYPVVIGIHDSMQQDEVITMLVSKGYSKIISIPLRMGMRVYRIEIRKIYNLILDNAIEKIGSIPCYKEETFEDDCKIADNSEYITFWLDSLFLFTMYTKYAVETNYSKLPLKEQDDICMLNNITHDVFSYFINGQTSQAEVGYDGMIQQHIALNTMSPMEFWNQRKRLYEFYSEELRYGIQYFIDNPLDVTLNKERNRVNLLDGHHRAGFLLAANYAKIPVRICREEFEILCKQTKHISKWCEDKQYPNLLNTTDALSIRYMQMLDVLYKGLKRHAWREWNILVIGDAFIAQHLSKERARVMLVTNDSEVKVVNKELDVKNVRCIEEKNLNNLQENIDCVIICQKRIECEEHVLQGLGVLDIKKVIWFSGNNPKEEMLRMPKNIKQMDYKRSRYFFEDLVEQEWGIFDRFTEG